MKFCKNCGAAMDDDASFCSFCGTKAGETNAGEPNGKPNESTGKTEEKVKSTVDKVLNTNDESGNMDPADIEKNKVLSLFSYLGLLFLIPLLAAKDSKYAMFHVNQGILLFIVSLIWNVLSGIVGVIGILTAGVLGVIFSIIGWIVNLGILGLVIFGIVNAVTGKAKELPLIGKFRIIK